MATNFVRIGFKGDPKSNRQMPRFRLNPSNVNKVFNSDIEFLEEGETGTIVWPKDWATDCLSPPTIYYIKEKAWPELDIDAAEEEEYRGQSLIIIDNVPPEVTEAALTTWLGAGLDDDDPDLAAAKAQLEELLDRQSRVNKQIKELPSLRMGGLTDKEELDLKKKRAEVLAMMKTDLDEDVRALAYKFDALSALRQNSRDAGFTLRLAETTMPLNVNVWEARFGDDSHSARSAYIAAHKFNWSLFRLAIHRATGEAISGKIEMPRMTEHFAEVNMRNVTVSRRRHGVGMYRYADERGLYSGHFRHGLRHGTGTEINQEGRFQGAFEKDWRKGPGSQVYARGDTLRCAYGGSRFHKNESLLYGDEYLDGVPHGNGRAAFADGSEYEGEWKDGAPCGAGRYIASNGVAMEGDFGPWASLEGFGTVSSGEVTSMGSWHLGALHGEGLELDVTMGSYDGDWRRGEQHGYGTYTAVLVHGKHVGWWRRGQRWGRGTLNFGHVERDSEEALTKRREAILAHARERAGAVASGAAGAAAVRSASERAAGGGGGDEGGENGDGGVGAPPRLTQFDLARGDKHPLLRYGGDYCYNGRWVAGLPRTGGVFTDRKGRAEPNLHRSKITTSGTNRALPGFADLDARETALYLERTKVARDTTKEALELRLAKEAENIHALSYWKRAADRAVVDILEKTRRGHSQLDSIRMLLKRPEVKWVHEGEQPGEELAVEDSSAMASLARAENEIKVVGLEDVKRGWVL